MRPIHSLKIQTLRLINKKENIKDQLKKIILCENTFDLLEVKSLQRIIILTENKFNK